MYLTKTLILLYSLSLCLEAGGSTKLPGDSFLTIVKDLESMSNVNPKGVETAAPGVLEELREVEPLTYYFIAYNIYVENLFNQGKIEKASRELDVMIKESLSQEDLESLAIALRTQGQFYYKLGLYERARESFQQAMEVCPPYDSGKLKSYFTWSSTLFGLVQADIQTGRLEDAEKWLSRMDGMMTWLESQGIEDKVGYKPVMILGLKAKISLQKGDVEKARALLAQCPGYIKPDIPSRAYVEYYVGEMMLAVKEGRHADAIPQLEELIEIHINDYKPIAATFLRQKGNSLYELRRYKESADAYREYEALQARIDEISIAHQLDELRTLYGVEKLEHEHDLMRNNMIIAMICCVALLLIVAVIMVNQRRVKHKDIALAQNISSLHQLSKQKESELEQADSEPEESPNPEHIEVGNAIVDYIKTSKCFLSPSCGRETIKEALGVSEQLLSKAMPLVTGVTFVKYINRLRLDYAIDLLENHPEITIHRISSMCGFGTMRQFQRIFKQQYKLSPSAYREAREESQKSIGDNSDSSL